MRIKVKGIELIAVVIAGFLMIAIEYNNHLERSCGNASTDHTEGSICE